MSLIEKTTNQFAEKISSELNLDEDKREVIAYGAFAIVQMGFSIFLAALFGWIFHVLVQVLVVSFSISILRKYSGGVHASTPSNCNIIGTTVCVGLAILLNYTYTSIDAMIVILFGLLVFVISFIIIYKVAPVDSPSKPIITERKKKRMKKGSIFVMCSYLLIVLNLLFFYFKTYENSLLLYTLCIYVGVAWQILTLTKVGHTYLTKLDTFLYQIIRKRRLNT